MALAREAKITEAKIADIAYGDFKQQSPQNIAPTAAAADNTIAQFPPGGGATDYIDTSILDELKASGFVAKAIATHKAFGLSVAPKA